MRVSYALLRDRKIRVHDAPSAVADQLRAGGFRLAAWDMSWSAALSRETAALTVSLITDLRDAADEIRTAAGKRESQGTVMFDAHAHLAVIKVRGTVPPGVRALPGWAFDSVNDVSTCYPEPVVLDVAAEYGLDVSPRAARAISDAVARLAGSAATDSTTVVALLDVLRPYQRAGAAYAVEHKRIINADEMGLGKTLQAIAATETTGLFPVLITCPASLRGNWVREVQKWTPHRTAEISDGRTVPAADYVIMSYEGLTALAATGTAAFAGVIFDEAHALKNELSQRTRAAHKVTRVLPANGLMLFLTGTPVVNRPSELVEPLLMLGILSDAPGARMTPAWFRERFCGAGTSNALELARFLRSTCMLRRTKAQVLTELPDKQRVDVWVPLSPEARALYEKLAVEGLDHAQGSRAKALIYLNALRHATGRAKQEAALDWATGFLESTGRQLVIFAHYVDMQQALINGLRDRGYPVAHILGGQRDVEEHKAEFMAGTARVIVCSMTAACKGHTLTAASDVLMTEQVWTPGDHWQAEDRCHRIGQENAVNAYYLLAEDTIDQWMFDLVDGKAELLTMITDGDDTRPDENTAMGYLLRMLAGRFEQSGARLAA